MHSDSGGTTGPSPPSDEADSLEVQARLLRQFVSHLEGARADLLARLESNASSLAAYRSQLARTENLLADLRSPAPN